MKYPDCYGEILHDARVYKIPTIEDGDIIVIASIDNEWEHVSVSLNNRCATWKEMCFVKDMFWEDEECVIQFHPPKSKYVNIDPYCLHMWKPVGRDLYSELEVPRGVKKIMQESV